MKYVMVLIFLVTNLVNAQSDTALRKTIAEATQLQRSGTAQGLIGFAVGLVGVFVAATSPTYRSDTKTIGYGLIGIGIILDIGAIIKFQRASLLLASVNSKK